MITSTAHGTEGYSSTKGGYVTTTGQIYPTTNPNFIPWTSTSGNKYGTFPASSPRLTIVLRKGKLNVDYSKLEALNEVDDDTDIKIYIQGIDIDNERNEITLKAAVRLGFGLIDMQKVEHKTQKIIGTKSIKRIQYEV